MKINVPSIGQTDILIIGGTTGAVEAALAATEKGRRVFLATPFSYVGEDVCATWQYWLDPDQQPQTELVKEIFGPYLTDRKLPSPMEVKYTLERKLIDAGVELLYMSAPTHLLRDEKGTLAGVVLANRSGFQAVSARAVVDATSRALVGRMTTAEFRPWRAGDYLCKRVVIGGAGKPVEGSPARSLPELVRIGESSYQAFEYELTLQINDPSPAAFNEAEVQSRLLTWDPEQMLASDRLDLLPSDRLRSPAEADGWSSADDLDLDACRCGNDALYVLSACADISDAVATELMKPCNVMRVGQRLGSLAASLAETITIQGSPVVDYANVETIADCDVCRKDRYFRLDDNGLELDLNRVPVLADCDVIIAGGGTAGAPAGIAAGRAGADAIVLEYQPGLGGIGTEGRIAKYYHGNRCGFTTEIDKGVHALGPNPEFEWDNGGWNTEWKRQWYLKESVAADTQVWFGSLNVAAALNGDSVCGVLAATPYGFGLVTAKTVVDCTGGADVAAAAGAETVVVSKTHVAVQGTGLSPLIPGKHYTNTDHTFVDETDIKDITRSFLVAREKMKDSFDLSQIINSRERRQIVGDTELEALGFLAGRTFPDTVVTARSNFDSHGFTIHPVFMARPPNKEQLQAHVPLRCLLPKGLEGVLVTGLGISCHRDALPVVRMQPDVQNQGYAAGRAAATSALEGKAIRGIDIRALQKHLVEKEILEPDVATHEDSFPLPDEDIAAAVNEGIDDYLGLAIIFAHPEKTIPLLQQKYAESSEETKVQYARILGLLGDDAGIDTLIDELQKHDWDEGWNYRGMGQYGFSLSNVDTLLIAAAKSGNEKAMPAMLGKLASLEPVREFSHFRALTIAFEAQPNVEAAPDFGRLLTAEQVKGSAKQTIAEALTDVPEDWTDNTRRNRELKELLIARGLYACGDPEGQAKAVLEAYRKDLHGHYARHARAILAG